MRFGVEGCEGGVIERVGEEGKIGSREKLGVMKWMVGSVEE